MEGSIHRVLQTRDDVFGQDAPQTMAGFPRFRPTLVQHRIMLLLHRKNARLRKDGSRRFFHEARYAG